MAEEAVWEAEFACSCLLIAAAVPGKHLIVSGGLGGLCSVVNELVAVVVVAHDHVHHSLHEGLEHVMVEALDWLNERLEGLAKTKSCKNNQIMTLVCV